LAKTLQIDLSYFQMNEFLDIYIILSIEQYTIVFIYGC